MKKLTAIILCALMLFSCAALAETAEKESLGTVNVNGAFELRCRMPAGYTKSILTSERDTVVAFFTPEDESLPQITVSIAYNESYAADGVALRFNDITEQDLALIRESFLEVSDSAEFQDGETSHGTKVLIIRGTVGDEPYLGVYSIYNAYEVEIIATPGTGAPDSTLTDEQIQKMIDFASDLDFVEV